MSLIKVSAVYTFVNFFNAGINFIFIPILARYISVNDYGLLTMFTLLITFLTPLVGFNIHGAITRRYYQTNDDGFAKYVGNCIVVLLASTSIIIVLSLMFKHVLFSLLGLSLKYVLFAIAICVMQFINLVILSIWQVKNKAINYGTFQLAFALINILFSLYFIVFLKLGWEGRLYGIFLSTMIMALIAMCLLFGRKMALISYDLIDIKHAINFSLPLIPHSIGAVLISMSDRFILKSLKGLHETGLYMTAYQIASILLVLMTSFNSAFVPWLFNKLQHGDSSEKRKIVFLTYKIFFLLLVLCAIGSLAAKLLWTELLTDKYGESYKYFPVHLLAFAFNGMYLLVTNYLYYAEKTAILGYLTVFILILNYPLTYMLIKYVPDVGAALGVCISNFLMFLLTWYFSARNYKMPWAQALRPMINSN